MDAVYFGSRFGEQLIPYLDFLNIKDKLIDSSPLISESIGFLKKNASKDTVLLIDTLCFANWIYEEKGEFKSIIKEQPASEAIKVFSPAEYVSDEFNKTFSQFVQLISESFSKTVVIRTALPKYYVINNQLRDIEDRKVREGIREEYRFIKNCEKIVLANKKNTDCDLTQFYFLAKPTGRQMDWLLFEKECYEDIAGWISDYLDNGFKRRTPLYKFCLKRYIKYQYKTIKYQAFGRFFDLENWVDNIVVSASREFVCKHYDGFLRLKEESLKTDISEIPEVLMNNPNYEKEFSDSIIGYLGFHLNKETDACYSQKMFNNGLIERPLLLDIRNNAPVNQKLVTKHNAGYWYALSKGYDVKVAKTWLEYGEEKISPLPVDVYGSCVSGQSINEIFTGGGSAFIRNHYWFHVPMYEASKYKIAYRDDLFADKNDEMSKNVKNQFDHSVREDVMSSDADWVLLDLYSFISVNLFVLDSFCFADTTHKIANELKAENKIPWKGGFMQKKLADSSFIESIKKWCGWIKEKYGNNVILVDFAVSRLKIGDDDIIYNSYSNASVKNVLTEKARDIIIKELDCYIISFGKQFLADDTGYNSSSAVHYELTFYEEVYKTVCYIIDNKPDKKVFDTYSNNVKMDRILRLLDKNNPSVLKRYFTTGLDNIILQLSSEMVYKNKNDIVKAMNAYENGTELPECICLVNNRQLAYEMERILSLPEIKKAEEDDEFFMALDTDQPKSEVDEIYEKNSRYLQSNSHYIAEFYDEGKLIDSITITFGLGARLPKAPEKNKRFLGWKTIRKSDGFTVLVNGLGKRRTLPTSSIGEEWKQYLYPDCSFNAKGSRIEGDILEFHAVYESEEEN